MTTLRTSTEPPATATADVLLVGIAEGAEGPVLAPGADDVDVALGGRLVEVLSALGATGAADEVTRLATLGATTAPTLAAVGLGPVQEAYDDETLRRAAGAATRALAGTGVVATTLSSTGAAAAVAEGALLGAYQFTAYRSASRAATEPPVEEVVLLGVAGEPAWLERARVLAEAVGLTRDLVNTPPRDLSPAAFAERAQWLAAEHGLDVEVLDETALAEGGYGGLLGVGAGSTRPPRLVRLHHRGRGDRGPERSGPDAAIVGKGITFDSGGLSLKPPQAMETMKSDMAGAAATLATLVAAARLHLPVDVVGWLPLAENLPSGSATRPSDVLTLRGGRTVEVLNTDAEGRLVLGDAIARAAEESPALIVDVATLTGAQRIALGNRTSGVMGTDSGRQQVVDAADRAGEEMWPMPLPPDLRASLDSDIADSKNTGERNGGMLVGGLFLRDFVPDGIPWAHVDIAGPSFNEGSAHGHTPKGGTGVAVGTLVALLEGLG